MEHTLQPVYIKMSSEKPFAKKIAETSFLGYQEARKK
jgi:hypothetical protein